MKKEKVDQLIADIYDDGGYGIIIHFDDDSGNPIYKHTMPFKFIGVPHPSEITGKTLHLKSANFAQVKDNVKLIVNTLRTMADSIEQEFAKRLTETPR